MTAEPAPARFRRLRATSRWVDRVMAALFALQIAIAIVGVPDGIKAWFFGQDASHETSPPRYVIVLGGGGIPSEAGLMRTYYAAEFGAGKTGMTFIVSLPSDQDPEHSSVGRMRDELVMRGIPAASVRMEYRGRSTHEEAVNLAALLGPEGRREPVLLVTSPYHMRRSLLCFRKAGFRRVHSLSAYDTMPEADVGPHVGLRYNFWGQLELEIRLAREACAMVFYKVRGWI